MSRGELNITHHVKYVLIKSLSWSAFSSIQSEYGEVWPGKNPYLGNYHAVTTFENKKKSGSRSLYWSEVHSEYFEEMTAFAKIAMFD